MNVSQDVIRFMLEEGYRLGREHRHREDELVRANNAQLEENRAQRRQIKQLEALVRLMRYRLEDALEIRDADGDIRPDILQGALQASAEMPAGEEYRYQDQVEDLAERILKAHGIEGVELAENMIGLAEEISLFLRDEIGV